MIFALELHQKAPALEVLLGLVFAIYCSRGLHGVDELSRTSYWVYLGVP